MTNLKLTNGQIEAIRALSAELADKLEAGEAVTLEKAVEKWEPNSKMVEHMRKIYAPEARAACTLIAYRDEFAPGYVVPPLGEMAWCPIICHDGKFRAANHIGRNPTAIYMPYDICLDLCRKLNSGEVAL